MNQPVVHNSLVGRVLGGKYRIERQIAEGGFGVVYRATHIGLGKPRAVKVLRHISPDRRQRFEMEARALAELDHPYIVAVVDVGVTEEANPYLVMEFIEGRSLGDILAVEERLPLARAFRIMKCVCSAVHYAHERGIIHRDLKPGNIIVQRLSGEGEIAKVLDFGLAKFTEQYTSSGTRAHPVTESGMILGTVEYLSPEQCAGQPIDARSDIYALGVILYQMLAGRVPFTGDTPLAILTQHINAPPPRIRDVCPDLPASVERVICRAMAKNPVRRQQTALQLRDELEQAIRHPSHVSLEGTTVISSAVRRPWSIVRRPWSLVMGGALLVLALLVTFHFYPREEPKPQPWVIVDQAGQRENFALSRDGRPNARLWNAPSTWRLVPGKQWPGDGALLVRGSELGTLRPPAGTALYDFWLQFPVTLEGGRRITWALRVQGPDRYYFFELTFPETDQESAEIQGYVYAPQYDEPHPFSPNARTIPFGPPRKGDQYWIEVKAVGHLFEYTFTRDTINPASEEADRIDGPYTIRLEPEPRDRKYAYGTIGFGRLSDGEALKIEYVLIKAVAPQSEVGHHSAESGRRHAQLVARSTILDVHFPNLEPAGDRAFGQPVVNTTRTGYNK